MQVTHSLAVGGSEVLAAAIAEAGVRQGIRMSICGLNCGGGLEVSLRNAGVTTHVIGRRPGVQPAVIVELAKLFRREKATVVLTHHLGQLLYSAIGAHLAGARLIHVEHDYYTLTSARSKRLLRLAGGLAERIIGVTDEVARFLVDEAKLPTRKVSLVRNGVDASRFGPLAGREREGLGISQGRPIVGTVGRLAPAKDQRSLIAAFRAVVAAVPDAVLVIIGEGPMRLELERDVKRYALGESVRFLGERFDVPALLPCMDVFVLSSVHEGLPLALLEAMACARPVVVTDVGGVAAVVDRGRAGVVVAPGDVDGLAKAVIGLLRDPALAARLGAAARTIVEQRYDLRSTIDAYLALCRGPLPGAAGLTEYSARPGPGRR
jgi:glycosyltransferase involved in cell wall biosynthesis